ncbi:hypothetical protein Y032_0012g1774 [Ancylostoma ceylanicum]|uniref:Uncharacterized protein n=1 Tax=Ancylostoma ceylanicum TaxID=53326 RepID=A0A016VC35_9BILA|nr:hypothetical protein Y032_0012g1774 [Ancylostoma ceylanicum]
MMTWTARKRGCLDRLGGLVVSDRRCEVASVFSSRFCVDWYLSAGWIFAVKREMPFEKIHPAPRYQSTQNRELNTLATSHLEKDSNEC